MITAYLALLIGCGGFTGCSQHYELYPTRASCEVRLAEWNSSGYIWNQPGRSGWCDLREKLTPEDIAIYGGLR